MEAEFRLGIQSYCFREFQPVPNLIDCLKQVGLSYVEIWPGHLDFSGDEGMVRRGLRAFETAGISVDAYGVVGLGSDAAKDRKVARWCKEAGVAAVSVGGVPDAAIEPTERLCEEYDLRVAVHNHGRNHDFGAFDVLEDLFSRTSERIGLCLDTAWALDSGEDPVAGVDRFAERLYGVHLKDFVFDEDGHHDVIIGTGGLDLPRFMRRLRNIGFDGYMSLEYEGNPNDPMDEVQECMRAVEDAIECIR